MGNNPNYNQEFGASKFSAWIQELIAIDIIRRATHNEFIMLDYSPERCLACFSGINEMYRIMRPMLKDSELQRKMDERALKIREDCLSHFRGIEKMRKNNPMAETQLSQELWNKLDDYFTDIYTIRHELGMGIRKVDKPISEAELKKKLVREL